MSRYPRPITAPVADDLAAQDAALDVECPRCGAERDAYCTNPITGRHPAQPDQPPTAAAGRERGQRMTTPEQRLERASWLERRSYVEARLCRRPLTVGQVWKINRQLAAIDARLGDHREGTP